MSIFDILLAVVWIVATLFIVTIASSLAKKFGSNALIGLYAAMAIASTVTATKIVRLVAFDVTASIIVFASTFLITDLIAECYGKRKAQIAVYVGFISTLIYAGHALITVYWPSVPYWDGQEAYQRIIGLSVRVGIAGPIAFFVSQLSDVFIFHAIRKRTRERKLWFRNILSTSVSQLIDTIIFMIIAFAGVFPLIPLILGTWVVKIAIAFMDTPFIYIGRRIITGKWHGSEDMISEPSFDNQLKP